MLVEGFGRTGLEQATVGECADMGSVGEEFYRVMGDVEEGEVVVLLEFAKEEAKLTAEGGIEVVGTWKGGRRGTFREGKGYEGRAEGTQGSSPVGAYDGYAPLIAAVIPFLKTGVAPVRPEETLEIFAFMEAADESKRRGGSEVTLAEVLEKARHR